MKKQKQSQINSQQIINAAQGLNAKGLALGNELQRINILQSILLYSNDAIIISDAEPISQPGPVILYVNKAFSNMTGYAPEEVIGKTPRIMQGEKTNRETLNRIRDSLKAWKPVLAELLNYRKDGSEFWVELNIIPIADEKGWYTHWLSIQRDITERKQLEQKLIEQSEALHKINVIGKVLNAELNLQKLIQTITDGATELAGAQFGAFFYTMHDENQGDYFNLYAVSGAPIEAFNKFPLPRKTALFAPTFDGKGIVRINNIKKDSRHGQNQPYNGLPPGHLPVTSYMAIPVISRSGEVMGGLLFGHEEEAKFGYKEEQLIAALASQASIALDNARLFESLEKERDKIKESEAKFRRLFEANIIGVFISESDGQIIEANEAFLKIVDYSRQDLLDKKLNLEQLIPRKYQGLHQEIENLILQNGIVPPIEKEYIRRDGKHIPVLLGAALLEINKRISFILDISQTKEQEKRKDEFISMASHELKTPLTSLKIFTQVLQDLIKEKNFENSSFYLEKINNQTDKLTKLVSDLLDISRIEAGMLEYYKTHFDLNELIQEVIENCAAFSGKHHIIVEGKITNPIYADRNRLEQVLLNLIGNALKYSPQAQKVIIKLSELNNQKIQVDIQDFGIGISEENCAKLFKRFFRVYGNSEKTFPGLGIGLYISSEIIKNHGGEIFVKSQKDKGSVFSFILPQN